MSSTRPAHDNGGSAGPFEDVASPADPARGHAHGSTVAVGAGASRRWAGAFAVLLVLVAGVGFAGRLGASDSGVLPAASAIGGGVPRATLAAGPAAAPSGTPPPGEIFVSDPSTLAPRAALTVPTDGSSWTDMARIPVAGEVSHGVAEIWVTVTSARLLLGQASLTVGADGRFAGFVSITPPPTDEPAEVRAIEPGSAPGLLALVRIFVGTSRRLLVSQAQALPVGRAGEAVQLQGIVQRDVSRVIVRLETAFGPSGSTAATLDPPVAAASGYLALWRTFRATVQLPRGAACGDAWLSVSGTWPVAGGGHAGAAQPAGGDAGSGSSPAAAAQGDAQPIWVCSR